MKMRRKPSNRNVLGALAAITVAALVAACGRPAVPPSDPIAEELARLTPHQRAALTVAAALPLLGDTLPERLRAELATGAAGAVVLPAAALPRLRTILDSLNAGAPRLLMVVVEADPTATGVGDGRPSAAQLLATLAPVQEVAAAGEDAGRRLFAAGGDLAIVDLPRMNGREPMSAALLAARWDPSSPGPYWEGMRRAGVAVGVRALASSDTGVAPLRWDRARLEAFELPELQAALAAEVAGVVLAASRLPALTGDSLPLPLSSAAVGGLLRRDLGFEGVVMADLAQLAARMGGDDVAALAVAALAAGVDLLLGVEEPARVADAIAAAVDSGRLPQGRLAEAAGRVLRLRGQVGVGDSARVARRAEAAREAALAAAAGAPGDPRSGEAADTAATHAAAGGSAAGGTSGGMPTDAAAGRSAAGGRSGGAPTDTAAGGSAAGGTSGGAPTEAAVGASAPGATAGVPAESTAAGVSTSVEMVREPAVVGARVAVVGQLAAAPSSRAADSILAAYLTRGVDAVEGVQGSRADERGGGGAGEAGAGRAAAVVWPPAPQLEVAAAASVEMEAALGGRIDALMRSALQDSVYSGAAVAVGRRGGLVVLRGYGRSGFDGGGEPVDPRQTVFDLASLSKVVGTTTAVALLVDEGRMDLDVPLRRYLPAFEGEGKEEVRIRHLLSHTSGLPSGLWVFGSAGSPEEALRQILRQPLLREPGERMEYSDLGMILLAAAAERAAGMPLDRFLARRVFAPLGMQSTMYLPPLALREAIVPTAGITERDFPLKGVVHDANSFRLGGVAGHAGLFSTARDLAVFAQMMLNGGSYGTLRILSQATVAAFTLRQPGAEQRALGWDTPSRVSSAGAYFSARSFGHTGYTGTSLWIDPESGVFVVLLTNRTYPEASAREILELRADIHDAAARAVTDRRVRRR